MIIEIRKTALVFPGQEKRVGDEDPHSPEHTLLRRILDPYEAIVQKVRKLTNVVLYGTSFGIYAALVAGESLTPEDASNLVVSRGNIVRATETRMEKQALDAAARGEDTTFMGRTGMLRLMGIDPAIREKVRENFGLTLSNDYGPIVVITGYLNAINKAISELGNPKGAAILDVDGAFHNPIRQKMGDSDEFSKVVAETRVEKANRPVFSSTNPRELKHPDDIREELVGMMYRPVSLKEVLKAFMENGINVAFDLDQYASFKKLTGKLEEFKGKLQVFTRLEEAF